MKFNTCIADDIIGKLKKDNIDIKVVSIAPRTNIASKPEDGYIPIELDIDYKYSFKERIVHIPIGHYLGGKAQQPLRNLCVGAWVKAIKKCIDVKKTGDKEIESPDKYIRKKAEKYVAKNLAEYVVEHFGNDQDASENLIETACNYTKINKKEFQKIVSELLEAEKEDIERD